MHLALVNNFFSKTSRGISDGIRNTSCNGGWLQIFTHIVCGVFTVTSFIFILMVAFNTSKPRPNYGSRCQLSGCRVICHGAPFYEEYEDDIVLAVMAAEMNCRDVFLTLTEPRFTNESLPRNWLNRLRPVLVEIGIIGGNLHHISHDAFSAAFTRNLKLLLLEKITISSWSRYALLGFANLETIFIKKCNIVDMRENFLSAVSLSLSTLTVIDSGYWNPENLTGSSQFSMFSLLTWVDLSSNDFGGNLGKASFTRLKYCKSLHLASNRISYIEPGAFDNLNPHEEKLFMNSSLLAKQMNQNE
ncbi:uncharacterized protein LOC125228061 [Leguminivora glycinivorella]|uniref:uncharacterized protein LOC125228061 n=1 Tax=Leguminivora glycinivorella TaxID=1035111 RepID=UPI00200E92E9|nr:uncharacterized protein LOC125228061 [Leguminivora glycinivorella]